MRILVASAFSAFALAILGGCPESMGSAGKAPDASATKGAPVNTSEITRYPYEKKLKDVPGTLLKDGVARKSPPDGPPITTVPQGTTVTQIAQTSDSFLVTFDDPSSGARKMGWIAENAFTNAPVPVIGGGGGGGGGHATSSSGGATSSSSGGAPPPNPGGNTIFTQPVNGQCPSGFVKSNVGCHRTCGADGDCPSGVKCKSGMVGPTKICTTG